MVVVILAPNGVGPTHLSLVECDSSTDNVFIGVIVTLATLLAVAIAALLVMIYKIRV